MPSATRFRLSPRPCKLHSIALGLSLLSLSFGCLRISMCFLFSPRSPCASLFFPLFSHPFFLLPLLLRLFPSLLLFASPESSETSPRHQMSELCSALRCMCPSCAPLKRSLQPGQSLVRPCESTSFFFQCKTLRGAASFDLSAIFRGGSTDPAAEDPAEDCPRGTSGSAPSPSGCSPLLSHGTCLTNSVLNALYRSSHRQSPHRPHRLQSLLGGHQQLAMAAPLVLPCALLISRKTVVKAEL